MPATYTAFTPPNVTADTSAPTAFTPSNVTPSTSSPGTFYPINGPLGSVSELSAQPTVGVTPAATIVVEVTNAGVTTVWQLTAGTHAADSTHVLPYDYNASTNAKYWLQIASH